MLCNDTACEGGGVWEKWSWKDEHSGQAVWNRLAVVHLEDSSFKRTCFHSNVIELDFESMHVSMQCVSLSWMLKLLLRRCFSLCRLTSGPPSNSWLSLNVNVLASNGM